MNYMHRRNRVTYFLPLAMGGEVEAEEGAEEVHHQKFHSSLLIKAR